LSSLFEVPAQLALVLTLAASGPGDGARPAPPPAETGALATAQLVLNPEPLEGPYRFSESSWLRTLREDLPAGDALAAYSGRIFKTSGGRYYVPAVADRRPILAARANAAVAERAAGAFAADNAARLRGALNRPVSAGDLYIAHVFGPDAAIAFIRQAEAHPNDSAAELAPDLVPPAPEPEDGTPPPTLAQLYNRLTEPMRRFARGAAAPAALRAHARERDAALDLKPTLGDMVAPRPAPAAANAFAWHAEVDAGGGMPLPQ